MKQVIIENPVINSPFGEPTRHFRFTDEGITNEIVEGRRTSSYSFAVRHKLCLARLLDALLPALLWRRIEIPAAKDRAKEKP